MKAQIKSLLDYKDSYHICLLGLDKNEEQTEFTTGNQSDGSASKSGKISIRQFHEAVLKFLSVELVKYGFKYVSTLPGGFQQVHDLALRYGFQLINHDDFAATAASRDSIDLQGFSKLGNAPTNAASVAAGNSGNNNHSTVLHG